MAAFAVALTIGLHGSSSLKVFLIVFGNYMLAKQFAGRRFGPVVLWASNIAVLFANELNNGYRFGALHSGLAFLVGGSIACRCRLFINIRMHIVAYTQDGM